MKFISILMITTLFFVTSPKLFSSNPKLNQKKIIVELTIPDFLDAERIEVPRKKRRSVTGGGGRGVSHPNPETLKAIKIWSYSYGLSLLKQGKASVMLDFWLSYAADGEHSINKFIEIKSGEVTEVEFQDGIKLKAYFEGDAESRTPPNNSFNRSGISGSLIVNLSHDAVVSWRVNSGAMCLQRINGGM